MADPSQHDPSRSERASADRARETAFDSLAQQAAQGDLTLDEFVTHAAAVDDPRKLDESTGRVTPRSSGAAGGSRRSRLVGIFGRTEQRGRWRLSSQLRIVA